MSGSVNKIILGDCLEVMKSIADKSIDMILCDLPYGTTQNKWDSIIELSSLWLQYERIIKDKGTIVLTAQTPFDKVLGCSNLKLLKYEWIWEKSKATGHLNSKKTPIKAHENILVFYKSLPTYNPQMRQGEPYKARGGKTTTDTYGTHTDKRNDSNGMYYPRTVIQFPSEMRPIHPTQKPVELFEYLIKTYTNEGDIVLDNAAGSGTTAIACINTDRNYICMEKDYKYFELMKSRINNHNIEEKLKRIEGII